MISGLNHLTIAVSNLDRSLAFYIDLLGMNGHARWDNGAYLSAGTLWLCLSRGEPAPRRDYTHFAFTVPADGFAAFCSQLIDAGVEIWKDNSSEGDSLYLLDPDGHQLEIHCGDLNSRLASLRQQPYSGLQWL